MNKYAQNITNWTIQLYIIRVWMLEACLNLLR